MTWQNFAVCDDARRKDSKHMVSTKERSTRKRSPTEAESKKISLLNLTPQELEAELVAMGEKPFRAAQIYREMNRRLVDSFEAMTAIPIPLRGKLAELFLIDPLTESLRLKSKDGSTDKVLFKLEDGGMIETVLMRYEADEHRKLRRTVCISTQSGCALGCVFCATGQQGFDRHLQVSEIVGQVIYMERIARKENAEMGLPEEYGVSNVVLMGMGEPLHNYDNTMKAIRALNEPKGLGIGARRITVSTVGLVPKILQLADEGLQINLAVSLHAANDEKRSALVPVNRKWNLSQLIDACRKYSRKTGRRIFFEYVMLKGQNDSIQDASNLGRLLEGVNAHVNLIPVNPTEKGEWERTEREVEKDFQTELATFDIPSTIRMEKGIDINAGCGQLRARQIGQQAEQRK